MLPTTLQNHLETILKARIAEVRPISGGDIHRAFRLTATDGREWFVKTNNTAQAPTMFKTEAQGLALLGASQVIRTPKILGQGCTDDGHAYLLLEYIAPGYKNRLFWENFGRALSNLHGNTSAQFGFAHNNFIGSLPQSNTRHPSWEAFYAEERLWPQMLLACEKGYFDKNSETQLDHLCRKIAWLCPKESPALTHGDLWSGNFICDTSGQAVLIDPAAAFTHREMDLAMSRLFGGFDAAFYNAYEESWPLESGFEKRMEVYQLYYLLVHVNLFGGGYVEQVRGILKRWG
ncbi:MAG: fructosamine kinase family protein [Saprospiraceae bacterium]|nr:fructosamine kinase family protein [Saprospiraceae bacterium]